MHYNDKARDAMSHTLAIHRFITKGLLRSTKRFRKRLSNGQRILTKTLL